jgi:uncharacterized protein (DUF2267 family)
MEEIVKLVAAKAGLPEDTARVAVETVIRFLKDKLPAPLGAQLDAVLGGEGGQAADLLGGLLGKK